jgi:acyl dehydratase
MSAANAASDLGIETSNAIWSVISRPGKGYPLFEASATSRELPKGSSAAGDAMTERYLEDYAVGQRFGSGRITIDIAAMKAFAAEFDPQPFHLDEAAARASMFGGLAASGWYTASASMRLLVEGELKPSGGIIGLGFEELRWPRPVRAGDELRVESEVLEVRPSRSQPTHGIVKARTTTLNQRDEPVQVLVANLWVPRRQTA